MIYYLEAPCIFCGYNGEYYWQKHSHDAACPLYELGGDEDRRARFPPLSTREFYARIVALEKVVALCAIPLEALRATECDENGASLAPELKQSIREAVNNSRLALAHNLDRKVGG